MPEFDLVVKSPVAGFSVGDRITDRETIAKILGTEAETHVVKVAATPPAETPSEA